ncbi:unnamed protein product [Orchesella dallaii]|uniref:C2H2-type domain-containing protein n=1 Tax=Orchesella dallaii TaxID=48710 RepID=A0ABP1R4M1_9HEXA
MDSSLHSTCIFCFKPATQSQAHFEGNKRNFFALFTRHLKIPIKNPTSSNADLNGVPNNDNPISQTEKLRFCEQCFKVEESFCDLYFQLDEIRSQLDAKVKVIYETIVDGDKRQLGSRVVNELPPSMEVEKEAEVGLQKLSGDIQRFRKDIIEHCELKFKLRSTSPKAELEFVSDDDVEDNVLRVKVETVSFPLDQDENQSERVETSNTLINDTLVKYEEEEVTIVPDALESGTAEYEDNFGNEDGEEGANAFSEDVEMILPDFKEEHERPDIYEYEGDEDHEIYEESDSSNNLIEFGTSSTSLFATNYVPTMTVANASPVQLQNVGVSQDLLLHYFPMPSSSQRVRAPDDLIRLNPKQVAPKELPGKCPICNKRFNCLSKERLQVHIKIEHDVAGKDPKNVFYCSVCQVPFTDKTFLDRHERNDHSQPTRRKIFKCSICKKKLFSASSLRGHIKSQHVYLPQGP